VLSTVELSRYRFSRFVSIDYFHHMKSWRNSEGWYAFLSILFLSGALYFLYAMFSGIITDRFRLFMTILRTIMFIVFGVLSLQEWRKIRKQKAQNAHEKDL
jgi:uncharacterized membrane protein